MEKEIEKQRKRMKEGSNERERLRKRNWELEEKLTPYHCCTRSISKIKT